ncbi:MAG: class II D-tagatose-bisphosphate aldolase, non-catalytic subunit [bacterium]
MRKFSTDYLINITKLQKQGISKGIYSICSANHLVLQTCMRSTRENGGPLLIEATCNQVNQYGGYTGMTPLQFRDYVHRMAAGVGLPDEHILLGGDHLGPNVWQNEPSASAMAKASQLVNDYVTNGFSKIHLDASMSCKDDPANQPLNKKVSSERIALLCKVAENAKGISNQSVYYVVGTEVPTPGGEMEKQDKLSVTKAEDTRETISEIHNAFIRHHLENAWERVLAVVVQPGVEFGDSSIFLYDRQEARELSKLIESYEHFVYEAHSTDYQPRRNLKELVEDHFAILKVGPALTFAMREALFALTFIEDNWTREPGERSNLREKLEMEMLTNPEHWKKHYHGSAFEQRLARMYSLSDRSRYYWPNSILQEAISILFKNLEKHPAPLSLIDQFLPNQSLKIKTGELTNNPLLLVQNKIREVVDDYIYACG